LTIENEDLDAAIAAGVVTPAQGGALRAFTTEREKARAAAVGHEERFRFMSGFNDFFIAIGILLLTIGIGIGFFPFLFPFFSPIPSLFAAAIMWALAELLVARMKLVLPGILLASLFVFFVFRAMPEIDFLPRFPFEMPQALGELPATLILGTTAPAAIALKALVSSAAAAVLYARFRLPFALLLVAGCLVIAAEAMASRLWSASELLLSLVTLFCGIAVFTAAMSFDLSDRERVTRRADCAFWLHLLAAPLLVNSLISFILPSNPRFAMTTMTAIAVLLMIAVLTIVAIVIDRRALLVSALTYLGSVIAYAISSGAAADRMMVLFDTMVILGVLVLALGVGWLSARRHLLPLFSPALVKRLPLVVPR
jgi:hypothetical protein